MRDRAPPAAPHRAALEPARAVEKNINDFSEELPASDFSAALQKSEPRGSSRRAGILRGLFLVIASIVLLPVFAALTLAAEISPVFMLGIFVIIFCAGLLRIVYALFFEASAPSDESEKG